MPRKTRRPSAGKPGREDGAADSGVRSDRIAALVLAGVVFAVFRNGLSNGLVGDDFSLINYCRPQGLGSLLGAFDPWRDTWYYRPITKLVFALAYTLFGTSSTGYHVLSLLAHASAVVLLYAVARRAGAAAVASFAGALAFAVHFRQHESVFWFSAISYPLSAVLALASALWFRESLERRRPALLAAALASAAAAMLTKDSAAVVPVLVALYGLLFAGEPFEGARPREKLLRLLPLALVFLVGVGLQAVPVTGRPFARGGTVFAPKSVAQSFAIVERSVVLLVPGLDTLGDAPRGAAALAALAALTAYVAVRRRPLALLGYAWAVLSFLPFYVFMPQIGDLYLYLPLAGVALVAVDAATLVSERAHAAPRALAALALAAFVLWSASSIDAKAARWHVAGEVVEGVVAEVKAARPTLGRGATLVLEGLPEYIGGVYAFQNAVPAALWLAYEDRTLNVVRPRPGDGPVDSAEARFLYEAGRFYEVDGLGRRRLLRTFSGAD